MFPGDVAISTHICRNALQALENSPRNLEIRFENPQLLAVCGCFPVRNGNTTGRRRRIVRALESIADTTFTRRKS
jgi:hypothetical protein